MVYLKWYSIDLFSVSSYLYIYIIENLSYSYNENINNLFYLTSSIIYNRFFLQQKLGYRIKDHIIISENNNNDQRIKMEKMENSM